MLCARSVAAAPLRLPLPLPEFEHIGDVSAREGGVASPVGKNSGEGRRAACSLCAFMQPPPREDRSETSIRSFAESLSPLTDHEFSVGWCSKEIQGGLQVETPIRRECPLKPI